MDGHIFMRDVDKYVHVSTVDVQRSWCLVCGFCVWRLVLAEIIEQKVTVVKIKCMMTAFIQSVIDVYSRVFNYRKRLRRGSRRPLNSVSHAETVPWRFHLRNVLHCFGGLWRWISGKFRIFLECSYKPREFSMVWQVSSLKAGALQNESI